MESEGEKKRKYTVGKSLISFWRKMAVPCTSPPRRTRIALFSMYSCTGIAVSLTHERARVCIGARYNTDKDGRGFRRN